MNNKLKNLRVAVSHYWLITWRGGEKVIRAILDIFPNADIYTLFADDNLIRKYLPGIPVYHSILNRFAFMQKNHQKVFPLYPFGIKSLKLKNNYDLIISSESGPAKGIKKPDNIPHICYVHTPMRYCWGFTNEYISGLPHLIRPIVKMLLWGLRMWDKTTIKNVDLYIANSENVKERIRKYYNKDSIVIYPPISKSLFDDNRVKKKGSKGEYYLSFGAIVPYKRVDLLVETFKQRKEKLLIIGEGSERKRLESFSSENVRFFGYVPDDKIRDYLIKAKALIFPGEEDFGMVPLEVMAAGVPVIAYGKGGALETVLEDTDPQRSTGIFFYDQTPSSLCEAIEKFNHVEECFDPYFIRSHAKKFEETNFKKSFLQIVAEVIDRHKNY